MNRTPLRSAAAAITVLIVASLTSACSASGTNTVAATSTAAPATAADDSTPGVTRASAADRKTIAELMKGATDYYRGLWDSARKFAAYPSEAARSKDPEYAAFQAKVQKDVVRQVSDAAIPVLMGKSNDDWNAWSDWESKTISTGVYLGGWANGQATELQASTPLSQAEADEAHLGN